MKHTAGTCPDLETIAAYLDGRLSDRERARVTEHLPECEECYAVFRESAQTHVEEVDQVVSIVSWRDRLLRPRILGASAAALAVAASLFVVVRGGIMSSGPDAQLRALVQAAGSDRMIEARLSGGFSYGEMRGPVRSGAASSPLASPDLRIAAAGVEKALAGVATPPALHAIGMASLLIGDFDRAIPTLEQAVERSEDARMLTDLSAAYLARAARDERGDDLTRALTTVDRAVKADPALPEARFNRALVLEKLSQADDARVAWRDYLSVDSTSGWAREAQRHLRERS